MKVKNQRASTVKYVINLASLLIFVLSYMYIFKGYEKKTQDLYDEAGNIKKQIEIRMDKISKKEEIIATTKNFEEQIQQKIDRYPVLLTKIDNLLFIKQMENDLNMSLKMLEVSNSRSFYDTGVAAQNHESADKSAGMTAYESTIALNFNTNYKGLKKMVDYIVNIKNRASIDSLLISSTADALTGTIVIKRYALSGTGKSYEEPVIEGVSLGTDNIFGLGSEDNDEQQ